MTNPMKLLSIRIVLVASLVGLVGPVYGQTNLAGEVAMANPPAIVMVGPASMPPGLYRAPNDAAFRYSGADLSWWDDSYPHSLFYHSSGITGLYCYLPYLVDFDTDAREFQVFLLGTQAQYRVKVDGQYVQLGLQEGPPADGEFYWLKITFSEARRRSITLELNAAFGGLVIGENDHLYRPVKPLGLKCVILGDSFSEGAICWSRRLANLMGWDVWISGVGGTGYINSGTPGRVKFIDRVNSDVIAHHPDIVIVAGGINDGFYPAEIGAAAGSLYDTILTNLPSSKLIVVGNWWPRGNPPQAVLDVRDALKNAALSRGVDFIDPIVATNASQINAGWITGTGNTGQSRGDGNADLYIGPDTTHPTDLGHQYLAACVAEHLKNIKVPDLTPEIHMQKPGPLWLKGRTGRSYAIQQCEDLGKADWREATSTTDDSGLLTWTDTSSTNIPQRYYRALLLP